MNSKSLHLCFVGNMLGKNAGYVTTQGQIVADLLAAEGYEVTCVSSKIMRVARFWEICATIIKKHQQFDVVVLEVYSGLSFFIAEAAAVLCKIFKLPLIMVLHGGKLPEFVENHPRRTKRVLRSADFLVAPSDFLAEKIGRHGFEIGVIPNVIDSENYPFRLRGEIKPRLLWMRSFHSIYNPQMAVKVLAALRENFPEATLTMAGVDKGLEGETKSLAAELNVSEAVRFPGFLDSDGKQWEFSLADIYLHTNRFDNMPVSVVEACAFGLPVVATKVGGVPHLISNGENGLLVESENVREMTEAVKLLLEHPALVRKLSRNAGSLAERSAWKSVKGDWEKLFDLISANKTVKNPAEVSGKKLKIEKLSLR